MKQVNKNHYNFEKYTTLPRWISYWNQLNEILKLKPKSVLVIGPGDGIVVEALKLHIDVVKTLDIAEDLKPDYLGSVLDIQSATTEKFDVIVCCQVLEHIPFEQFESALKSIKQNCNHALISLPFAHTNLIEFFIRLPKMICFYFNLIFPKFYKKWKFDGEHHWEVGCKGTEKKVITQKILKYFKIQNEYHVKFHHYHIFYVCDSK